MSDEVIKDLVSALTIGLDEIASSLEASGIIFCLDRAKRAARNETSRGVIEHLAAHVDRIAESLAEEDEAAEAREAKELIADMVRGKGESE